MKIIVNGREVESGEVVTYDGLIMLTPNAKNGDTVAYHKNADDRDGTLIRGQSVKVKDGTVFNVYDTSNA